MLYSTYFGQIHKFRYFPHTSFSRALELYASINLSEGAKLVGFFFYKLSNTLNGWSAISLSLAEGSDGRVALQATASLSSLTEFKKKSTNDNVYSIADG